MVTRDAYFCKQLLAVTGMASDGPDVRRHSAASFTLRNDSYISTSISRWRADR